MRTEDNCMEIIEKLEELISDSARFPGNIKLVNERAANELLFQLREKIPSEINTAREIVAQRDKIIREAKGEGQEILKRAENQARYLLDHEAIVIQAKKKSEDILLKANARSRELFNSAKQYTEDIFKIVDDALNNSIGQVRSSRQKVKNMSYSDFIKTADNRGENQE